MLDSKATRAIVAGRAFLLWTGLVAAMLFAPLAAADPPSTQNQELPKPPLPATVWHNAQDLAIYALGLIGVDYKFGGSSPERGLDCSGLVRYVFQQVTGVLLPRTAQELSRLGEKVPMAELMPGDLVFFNTRRLQFSHVGIYLGENRFIHAPRQGGEVEIVAFSKDYWQKHFDGARRLVGAIPDLIPAARAETGQIRATPSDDAASTPTAAPEELLP